MNYTGGAASKAVHSWLRTKTLSRVPDQDESLRTGRRRKPTWPHCREVSRH